MLGGIIGILIAFYIGFFIISPLMKNTELSFRVVFSIVLGLSFSSVLYFFSMLLNIYTYTNKHQQGSMVVEDFTLFLSKES